MGLVTGPLDGYDYLTFLFLLTAICAFFYLYVIIGGLPGKIAAQRKHPHAESVKLMGWIGMFAVFPWVHAFIWAYHDSLTVDVRKFPREAPDGGDVAAEPVAPGLDEPEEQPRAKPSVDEQ